MTDGCLVPCGWQHHGPAYITPLVTANSSDFISIGSDDGLWALMQGLDDEKVFVRQVVWSLKNCPQHSPAHRIINLLEVDETDAIIQYSGWQNSLASPSRYVESKQLVSATLAMTKTALTFMQQEFCPCLETIEDGLGEYLARYNNTSRGPMPW